MAGPPATLCPWTMVEGGNTTLVLIQGAEGETRSREKLCHDSQTWGGMAIYMMHPQLVWLPSGASQHPLQQSPSHNQLRQLVLPDTHCCRLQTPYCKTHHCYQLYKHSSPPNTQLLSALSIV